MTLDEAIKHIEEMEEEQEELYRLCPASESIFHCDGTKNCKSLKNGENKGCLKCAEEYRQLAEWLKDYKRLLEQVDKIYKISQIKSTEDLDGMNWEEMVIGLLKNVAE